MPTNVPAEQDAVASDLISRLRESINSGEAAPGEQLGSEYALARETGLSRHAVRQAVNTLIDDGLVERRAGQGLFVREPSLDVRDVQLVVGNLAWETMMHFARGARDFGRQRGVRMRLNDAHGDLELDLELLRHLPREGADGAIIGSLHTRRFAEVLFELKNQGFPFVLADELPDYLDVSAVAAGNYEAGQRVGQELLALGHQRIAFVGDLIAPTVRARLDGLRDAVNDAGVAFDRSLVVELEQDTERFEDWPSQVQKAVGHLMRRADRPTAIFFSCDAAAAPAYPMLKKLGFAIPDDVSVVGFDDASLGQWLEPPLSTVRQPMHAMGYAAMELLLKRIEDSEAPTEQRVLEAEWIRRDSLAAPPARSSYITPASRKGTNR
jgi:DNA-binding LacI/PurR family transcriptional regulator/biotin operon repressor